MKKQQIVGLLLSVVLLISTVFPAPFATAATFEDINDPSVFLKQQTSITCTLSSAAMMVRRAAILTGNENWRSITESSMRSTAWLEGQGLYYSFTYAGISVKHSYLPGGESNKATLISLLNEHPEGIILYYTGRPHAVLLTDYTNGVFYCADPANGSPEGRINIESALAVRITNSTEYWYVSSPACSITPTAPGKPALSGMQEFYTRDSNVTFKWSETENTTHYNLWLKKLDNASSWYDYASYFYATSGMTKQLEPGIYCAQLLAYNSDAWEDDHSDWKHTWGDDVVFVYDYAKGKCGDNAYWRLQDGVLTIWGSGTVYDYDDYNTRPWHPVKDLIKKVVVADGITYIGIHNFYSLENLTEVELPETLKGLGTWVFDHCSSLEQIVLPDSISSLSYSTFLNCKALKYVNIPSSLKYIGAYTFSGCTSLDHIIIPKNICLIKSYAFRDCTSLTNVYYDGPSTDWAAVVVEEGSPVLSSDALHCNTLRGKCGDSVSWDFDGSTLTLSGYGAVYDYDNYSERPWHAFKNSVRHVIVEEGITYLGVHCFYALENLINVELPTTLTGLGAWAFDWCINLEQIALPDAITSVDKSIFLNCRNLKDVNIPSAITYVGDHMFDGCKSLKSIIIPANIRKINDSAFLNCSSLSNVYYQGSSSQWGGVSIESNNAPLREATLHYSNLGGTCGVAATWSFDGKTLTISGTGYVDDYPGNDDAPWSSIRYEIINASVEEGITGLGVGTFYRCDNLVDIQLPSSLKRMGTWAIDHCTSLKTITLPDSINEISYSIFLNCSSLEDVNIPASLAFVGEHMFNGCTAMTKITIPTTVRKIKDNAFINCPSLTDVYYEGSYEQWQAMEIGSNNDCLTDANIHYCGRLENAGNHIIFDTQGGVFDSTCTQMDIDNINGGRGTHELTVFTGDGKVVDTNIYGYEVAVDKDGLVIDKRNYGDSDKHLTIPAGGFVLSANGATGAQKAGFVHDIDVGEYVAYDLNTMVVYHYTDYDEYLSQQKKVILNGVYGNLPIPEKEGHYFNGWTDDAGHPVDYYAVFSSERLTAIWADEETAPASQLIFNDHKYARYEYNLSWHDAKDFCESKGGHLVTITSAEEQAAVEDLLQGGRNIIYFIGCSDEGDEGNWSWVTGEPFSSFNKWDPQLPEPDTGAGYDYGGITNKAIGANKQFSEWLANYNTPDNLSFGYRLCNYGFICEFDSVCDHNYIEEITEPTCTNQGYTTHICSKCGDSYVDNYIPALEHNYQAAVTNPSCTAQGYTTHTCSRCGDIYVDTYVDALGHDLGEWTETKAATCTEKGAERRDCSRCEYYETREIEVLGHDYNDTVVDPTCTEQGYTTHACSRCEDSYVDTYVDALGHDFGEWTETKAATCTEKGAERRDCSRCEYYETREVEALGHDLGEWAETKAATCTEKGAERRDCSRCEHYETREIEVLGHDYKDTVADPTCTEQGYTTHTCSRCEDSYVDSYVDALGHDLGEWTETKAATCTEKGAERRDCSRCEYYETREIEVLGHDYKDTVTDPTCTEQGYTTHTCSRCDDSYVDTYVDALGHDFSEWTETKAATCTEKGAERRDCSRCEYYETREVEALGHDYKDTVTDPTCTEQGYTTHTCSRCEDSYVDTYVDALGHDLGEWTETKAATCTEKGAERRDCSRCEHYETREIEVLGHDYKDTVADPTCTEQGYTTHTCSRCDDSYVDSYVEALGHDLGEWTETKAANCTEKGAERRDCSRCEYYKTREVEALGHDYKDTVTDPTCTEQGYTTHTCSRCDDSYVDTYVDALGHVWDDGVVTKQPTATENGVKTFTCTRCGETRTEPIPATGDKPCDGGEDCPSGKFVDVNTKEWYHPYVDYAVAHGLFGGTSANTFEPETAMTRAMLVTVLWRYEGEPEAGKNTFSDVPNGQWYTKAVAWAAENGIVGGVGNNRFDPNGEITREQMATILFRYAEKKGIDTSKRGSLNIFSDEKQLSAYAKDAVQWAVAEQIINGSDGKLLPQGSATRAQVATILMRFIENKIK